MRSARETTRGYARRASYTIADGIYPSDRTCKSGGWSGVWVSVIGVLYCAIASLRNITWHLLSDPVVVPDGSLALQFRACFLIAWLIAVVCLDEIWRRLSVVRMPSMVRCPRANTMGEWVETTNQLCASY